MNRKSECESVVLTKDEKRLLKKIHRKGHISLTQEEAESLEDMGLIEQDSAKPDGRFPWVISVGAGTYHTTRFYNVYMAYTHREFSLLVLKSLWFPILVSLITSLIINGIIQLLLLL